MEFFIVIVLVLAMSLVLAFGIRMGRQEEDLRVLRIFRRVIADEMLRDVREIGRRSLEEEGGADGRMEMFNMLYKKIIE